MGALKRIFTRDNRFLIAFSTIVSILVTGSMYFYYNPSTGEGVPTYWWIEVLVAIVRLLLSFCFFFTILKAFNPKNIYYVNTKLFNRTRRLEVKDIIGDYVYFLLIWLVPLIVKYPGGLDYDTWALFEEFRLDQVTTHHFVFYMFVMGKLVGFCEARGSADLGLFIFETLHYLFLVLAFGYSCNILRRFGASNKVIWIYRLWTSLNPLIIGFIGVVIKDIFYSTNLFIAFLIISEGIILDDWIIPKWKLIIAGGAIVIACLTRKNGLYVILGVLLIIAISTFKNRRNYRILITIAVSVIMFIVASKGLNNYYHATPGSLREAFSLPFQQTARYSKYHGDDVTEEEKSIIDDCLTYETLASYYHPYRSDAVKGEYKDDASKLLPYFKVWFKQFWRHPLCYIAATWEQNYYLLVPELESKGISFIRDWESSEDENHNIYIKLWEKTEQDLFRVPQSFKIINNKILDFYFALFRLPIIGLFWYMTTSVYILLLITYISMNSERTLSIPIMFFWLTILCVILGPIVATRYMFFNIYATPFLVGMTIYESRHVKDNGFSED